MNVKASQIEWNEPPLELRNHKWFGPPGAMIRVNQDDEQSVKFLIACPRCGEIGSPKDGEKRTVESGSIDDVTTLTLKPSIAKSCCGWHGYLTNGEFVEC